ncbi:MAG: hypothetical protein HY508_06570 [Acidobacteria bacterium]|nr:hypothetical protein [Acidobacteriota bacterium]
MWPAVVTLVVTAVRLAGELLHGPRALFNPDTGGGFALVGIAWLAPVFGIYFALKLARGGHGPKSPMLAVQSSILGIIFVIVVVLSSTRVSISSPYLKAALLLWAPVAAAAAFQMVAWPALARTLFAYAFAARVPVAILMFFAMLGNWGTHYDAVPQGFPEAGLAFRYLWLGLLPQLVFWVGFTVLVGALFGSGAFALRKKRQPSPSELIG